MPPASFNPSNNNSGPFRIFHPAVGFVAIILIALVAFEIFNFSTTETALNDLLGGLEFAGISWSIILTIAFCGIDFAGIARLFTPEHGRDEPNEVWYLFGAWLLAATMNAILTWWGISIAVVSHYNETTSVMSPETMTRVVPIFVAIMVWVIRILIIGTLSLALDKVIYPNETHKSMLESGISSAVRHNTQPAAVSHFPNGLNSTVVSPRPAVNRNPAPKPSAARSRPVTQLVDEEVEEEFADAPVRGRMAPTYHTLSARSSNTGGTRGSSNRYR